MKGWNSLLVLRRSRRSGRRPYKSITNNDKENILKLVGKSIINSKCEVLVINPKVSLVEED